MRFPVNKNCKAFTLVEVTVSLAIVVFAGFAIIGLLGVALKNDQDSKQRLQAATIAEALCATLRGAPTNDLTSTQPYFALPGITNNANNMTASASPVYLNQDGTKTNAANASFGLYYHINVSSASQGTALAYFCLYWPAQANVTNSTTGRYEIATTFALP